MMLQLRIVCVLTLWSLVVLTSNAQNARSLTTGLVVWLQLDENAGVRAVDASGSGHTGIVMNGSTWLPTGGRVVEGQTSGGLRLVSSQYLTLPLRWQPRRFTVAWWVKVAAPLGNWTQAVGASLINSPDAWGSFLFHTSTDGIIYVGTDFPTRLETGPGTFLSSGFHHYAFTFDNGMATLYRDGILQASRLGMNLPAAWQNLSIGSTSGSLAANGDYDDLRVYDRALSAAEVTQLVNSTDKVHTPPVAAADDLDRNWSLVRSFDGNGNIIGESKSFSDALGRPIQSQAKSMTSGHVLASQSINNSGGKGAISTLSAPINNQEFRYQDQFVTAGGNNYNWHNFEDGKANNPDAVDQSNTPGTLGYYYGPSNTLEPLTATSRYPYSIGEEYSGPLGGAKRSASPGDELRMGRGHEARMREFPLLNELDHYLSLRPQFVAGTPVRASLRAKGEKSVAVDANGRESITFTDADGRTLASCLSGPQYPGLTLTAAIHSNSANSDGLPQYQDLHVPAAGAVPLTVMGTGEVQVVNLMTDVVQSYTLPDFVPGSVTVTLDPGFYRMVSKRNNQSLRYVAHYGDFNYSYYDDAGRVVATIGPKGVGTPVGAVTASPTTGLAGHWSFDEASGTSVADASGNNLSGVLMNQLGWSASNHGVVCGLGTEYQILTLQAPLGTGFTGIQAAHYGGGTGSDCASFVFNAGCSADVTAAVGNLTATQLASTPASFSVAITNPNMGTDPCVGPIKRLRVQAAYTSTIPASPAGGSFLIFDGQNDYVHVGDMAALRMSNTMSVEAWIYPLSNQDGIIINKENEYEVGRFADGSIQWAFHNTNPGWTWINTGITAPLNTWSHIGLTYNNGVVTAYLNGVPVGTPFNGSGSINYNGGEFWIGGRQCCGQFFHGAIDEVRVWSGIQAPSTTSIGPLTHTTRNIYSGTGTLLTTESPDEGRTEYVYARDGRIRFSQNPVQRQQGKFSYSNYDEAGRVVESGEYTSPSPLPQNVLVGRLEAEHAQTNGQVEYNVPGASGGQGVGYLTEPGRYVAFHHNVPRSGGYSLDFRYAAAGTTARTMNLYVDGVKVQQVTLPGTNSWTNWATQRVVVTLAAGAHTTMLRMDADNSGWINLDYLSVGDMTQGLIFENQLPVVAAYEAENANYNSDNPPATNHTGYRGTGFIGNLTSQGRFLEFTVNVPVDGRYPVHIRYAAGLSDWDRAMPVYVNWNYVFHAKFAPTNAWERWDTQTISVDLHAGANLIRFQHDGRPEEGWINIDYIDVAAPRQPASNSVLNLVEELMPVNNLDVARRSQRNQVWYDLPVADSQLAGRTQEFVLGAVAKTTNGTTTSWYSYDEMGRLTWLVQEAPGVGVKTVDYSYDLTGNVLEVAYQKGQRDAFYHHYEYDADQRLRAAYVSPDGQAQNRTLQAKYFYYIHGPLKRVELGDRLQGIDYAYTIQGWVKSINQAKRSLDPSADKPANNGFYKDLFGLTLDYFNGDYASRQLTPTAPTITTNQNDMRYNGSVRAASWQTAANPTVHANAYRYDAKGQLVQADYGQMSGSTFMAAANGAYEEGNLSYDAHGNIQTLRRRNGVGTTTDDFLYDYTANTNKLATVKSRTTNSSVFSYQYDANGQMSSEMEVGQGGKYLAYDVAGKVTGVYRDAAHQQPVVTFAYNDRGYRVSKTSYSTQDLVTKITRTYYVTDASGNILSTYEQLDGENTTQTEVPLYGASRLGIATRLDDGTLEPHYELNDQLGNARVVFRKPVTKKYTAGMEPGAASQEEADFDFIASSRLSFAYARTGGHVARLTPRNFQGPAKKLTVQKGDTVTFTAYAFYLTSGARSSARLLPFVAAGAVGGARAHATAPQGELPRVRRTNNILSRLAVGAAVVGLGTPRVTTPIFRTNIPAYLHYVFYDAQGNESGEHYEPVTTDAMGNWAKYQLGIRIPNDGKLLVEVVSHDPSRAIYFDDLEVEHSTGMIVQEQHQYAFGSPITGLNYTVGTKKYRHGYQGQHAEKDEETGWDSFELRMYNSRIGRWTAPDPYGQFHSPYVGMGNNPVSSVDPDGGFSGPPGFLSRLFGSVAVHTPRYSFDAATTVARTGGVISKAVGAGLLQGGIGALSGVARASGLGKAHSSVREMNGKWYGYQQQSKALNDMWSQSIKTNTEHMAVLTTKGIVVLPPAGRDEKGILYTNLPEETRYRPKRAGTIQVSNGKAYIYHHGVMLQITGTIHTHPTGNRKTNPLYYGMYHDAYISETALGATFAMDHHGLLAAGWLGGEPNTARNSPIISLKEMLSPDFDIIQYSQNSYFKVPPSK